ncbi:hypothetical protein ACFPIJ_62545 [Dactylosporangium cerinum]|uniref:Uncharacterized protein n=1 Tax=Dactylosporangium cerinum TaxID=1434730 RepID=A0ABV9WM92_9ACTN
MLSSAQGTFAGFATGEDSGPTRSTCAVQENVPLRSASTIVPRPLPSVIPAPTAPDRLTVNVSLSSLTASLMIGTEMGRLVCPGVNVTVPALAV